MYRSVTYVEGVGKVGKMEIDMSRYMTIHEAVPEGVHVIYSSPPYETSLTNRPKPTNEPHEGVAKQIFGIVKEGCGLKTIMSVTMTLDPGDISPDRHFGDRLAAIPQDFAVVYVSDPIAL